MLVSRCQSWSGPLFFFHGCTNIDPAQRGCVWQGFYCTVIFHFLASGARVRGRVNQKVAGESCRYEGDRINPGLSQCALANSCEVSQAPHENWRLSTSTELRCWFLVKHLSFYCCVCCWSDCVDCCFRNVPSLTWILTNTMTLRIWRG